MDVNGLLGIALVRCRRVQQNTEMLFLSFNETSGYAQIPRLCEDPAVAAGVQSCSIVTLVYQELPERNAVLHCGWYGVR